MAVAQAAAYIQQTKISADEYIKRFNEKSQKLFGYQQTTDEFSKTVNITWEISMEKIDEKEKERAETLKMPYPLATPLMDLCAYFDSRDIPTSVLLEWIKQNYQEQICSRRSSPNTRAFKRLFHDPMGRKRHFYSSSCATCCAQQTKTRKDTGNLWKSHVST